MAAQVRIGRITASVVPQAAAQVRIGRITASVTPATAGHAQVRIGRITASVVPPSTTASGTPLWQFGRFVTPATRKVESGGALAVAGQRRHWIGNQWVLPVPPPPAPDPIPAVPGFTLVSADDFATLDAAAWYTYDNSTFGAPDRIQRYMARNVTVGLASDGVGTSLKLTTKREAVGGNAFTAGMLDSKTAGRYAARYHRKEIRAKVPHGQGIWWGWWSTAFNLGADMVELDDGEGFHSQQPGKTEITLHRRNNAGVKQDNVAKAGRFIETPTYTPGWHTFTTEVYPVTDATGATPGDPNQPSSYVRIKAYLDGVKYFDYVDTEALYWTTNGGDPADPINRFWNIYIQGSQVDGKWVGHPDDPLGYSHLLNACISGAGTAPNGCPIAPGGVSIIRAQFPNTFELDYHRVWKWTG